MTLPWYAAASNGSSLEPVVGFQTTPGANTSGADYRPPWYSSTSIVTTAENNLEPVTQGIIQQSTQSGGITGDQGSETTDWANYQTAVGMGTQAAIDAYWPTMSTWAPVDSLFAHLNNARQRLLSLYGAPAVLCGNESSLAGQATVPLNSTPFTTADYWSDIDSNILASSKVSDFASYAHYTALRYTGQAATNANYSSSVQAYYRAHPMTHMSIWCEVRGYYDNDVTITGAGGFGSWRWDLYMAMYNAVWARVKGDPLTAGVRIGGPYMVTDPGKYNGGDPTELTGAWGSIDSRYTNGVRAFAGLKDPANATINLTSNTGHGTFAIPKALGCDYLVADISNSGSPLSTVNELAMFHDICNWYTTVICPGLGPLTVEEIYWTEGPSEIGPVLTVCFSGGAQAVYLFQQNGGTPGTACLFVDANGNQTDAYPYLAAWE